MRSSVLSVVPFYASLALSDRYASNQNPTVIDTPQVAANFPDVQDVKLLAPAFTDPGSVQPGFANGTSGPTSQSTLEKFVKGLAHGNGWFTYNDKLESEEGRKIPYVTLSNGEKGAKKLRIFIQGGIHGDEPAGDQGVLALLGKFANDSKWTEKVLKKVDLLILPRYNVDGVTYFQRQLASNYDPNRDHAILERDQTRAIRQLQSTFDPHIVTDNHEYTGVNPVAGYIRAQDLLVSANKNQNVNKDIRALNEQFVEDIFAAAKAKGLRVAPYFTTSVRNGTITVEEPNAHAQAIHKGSGNFQTITFLVETRGIRLANQHFQRRVASHIITLETILNKAVDEFDTVYNTIENGRKAFTASTDDIVVAYEQQITNKHLTFISANGTLVDVPVRSRNSDPYIVTLKRSRPKAYVFSRAFSDVAERLHILGVKVNVLEKDFVGTVEALVVENATLATTKFEGVAGTTVKTNATQRAVTIPAGGFYVDTRQKNAGYAFVLLEPEGEASLAYYNKIPLDLGDEYPIFRVL
ncbi:Zn-dependent exopeptidase [Cucurbitaria berberidis CBS 394.84]|uniref:Carboxypeptidase M14B n=1 Tax=Cucurbitaria berberidis CBS 394.84 TaxID=1168544 RepID=A0A9P4GDE6_9PLEO|nr:Zn-dependent exopeptidase [Cucurbitaria berberidis CBS 394.84]KAF1843204.1 Zn-dependent exopeptidase [Cucurbitaria berberidis CBS 394.84]